MTFSVSFTGRDININRLDVGAIERVKTAFLSRQKPQETPQNANKINKETKKKTTATTNGYKHQKQKKQ